MDKDQKELYDFFMQDKDLKEIYEELMPDDIDFHEWIALKEANVTHEEFDALQRNRKECFKCNKVFESLQGYYFHMLNSVCGRYCKDCKGFRKPHDKIRSFTTEQMLLCHANKDTKSICRNCNKAFDVKELKKKKEVAFADESRDDFFDDYVCTYGGEQRGFRNV